MTTKSEINVALRKLNIWLAKYTRNTYFDGIPVSAIGQQIDDLGFSSDELEGIYCGADGRSDACIGHGKYLHLTWHKMDVTGRYEIVAYAN